MKRCQNAHKTGKHKKIPTQKIPKQERTGGGVKGHLEFFRKFIHIGEQMRPLGWKVIFPEESYDADDEYKENWWNLGFNDDDGW